MPSLCRVARKEDGDDFLLDFKTRVLVKKLNSPSTTVTLILAAKQALSVQQ